VTDPEREHFVQQIQVLERRLRRSRLVIVVLAALLLMPLVGVGLLGLAVPVFMARERAAVMAAEEQAERARADAEAARQKERAERERQEAEKARREAVKAAADAGKQKGPGKD
jgi:flagellar biosynthesis component FlhA